MNDRPAVEANHVLAAHGITGYPAEYLQAIADAEKIKVLFYSIDDEPDFGGQLIYRGEKVGILVNTCIPNAGKHNFTFGHELGHYFLLHAPTYTMDGQSGFRCSITDIESSIQPQEMEANSFASALLMPPDLFQLAMAGSVLDYTLIANLAREFRVSKHACCNRVLEFTKDPYIVIRCQGYQITEIRASAAVSKRHLVKSIPKVSSAYNAITTKTDQHSFELCEATQWFPYADKSMHLYEWTRGSWKNNVSMTILRW